jgi:hypothetical protein
VRGFCSQPNVAVNRTALESRALDGPDAILHGAHAIKAFARVMVEKNLFAVIQRDGFRKRVICVPTAVSGFWADQLYVVDHAGIAVDSTARGGLFY